jgi:hypothetical protein
VQIQAGKMSELFFYWVYAVVHIAGIRALITQRFLRLVAYAFNLLTCSLAVPRVIVLTALWKSNHRYSGGAGVVALKPYPL